MHLKKSNFIKYRKSTYHLYSSSTYIATIEQLIYEDVYTIFAIVKKLL